MTHQFDEARLVARAKAARLDAFETLVRRYYTRVYRIALRILGNPADAEDATQEAFFDAWRGLPGFQGRSTFSTWMYRIVTHRSLKLLRASRPTEPLTDTLEAPPTSRPDHIVEAASRLEALERAIADLPPEQRAPLALREFEGLAYDQIAEVLEITVPAVKGRLHRARLKLMEAMRPWI